MRRVGDVIPFPQRDALRRAQPRRALDCLAAGRRALLRQEAAIAAAPPGRLPPAFLQHRDLGDEDGR